MDSKVIRHGGPGYAYSYRTSEGYNFDAHIHRCYEFLYIMEGDFFYTVEGNEYLLSSGDMVVTNPDELHSFSFPEKCTYKRQFLHIYPSMVQKFPEALQTLNTRIPGTCNRIPASLFNQYKLEEIFAGLREYSEYPRPESDFMILTYALQLITKTSVILNNEDLFSKEWNTNKNAQKIQDYIYKNFTQEINLDELANYMFLDKSYMCRLFRQETGMTIKTYINMCRVIHAKNRILSGQKATSIYSECGFQNYSTFYRSFQKYVGMTPEEFKTAITSIP